MIALLSFLQDKKKVTLCQMHEFRALWPSKIKSTWRTSVTPLSKTLVRKIVTQRNIVWEHHLKG